LNCYLRDLRVTDWLLAELCSELLTEFLTLGEFAVGDWALHVRQVFMGNRGENKMVMISGF
jgi:hypothetical protein